MLYRSTNADGRFVHYGGALVAGVEFGSGIELNPTSSGAIPRIQPAGDEQNKDIAIIGKGTGGVYIGSTATGGLAYRGAFTSTISYQLGAVSSGQVGLITLAATDCNIQPGDLIGAIEVTPTTNALIYGGYRTSTADTSRVTITMANPGSSATSTTSGQVRITWIDLTA